MATWRMSMRAGNQGPKMWPYCYELGVAAITYPPQFSDIDLSQYPKLEPAHLWTQLAPNQYASLCRVAYEMKKGDVIYVKEGPRIVGKGIVKGSYQFDHQHRLVDPYGNPWPHQVPVDWEHNFEPIDIKLGAEPITVLPLLDARLQRLEAAIGNTRMHIQEQEALEGQSYKAETTFRKRCRALIEAKKANSNGQCEACGFSFEKRYGSLSGDCLIAHHINPIGQRHGSSKTTLDDIALLCPNCHVVVHTQNPPMSLEVLRKRLKKYSVL